MDTPADGLKVLIGPLWNAAHIGSHIESPLIQPFYMGEAALRSFLPKGLGKEYYAFHPRCMEADFLQTYRLKIADIFAGLPDGWMPDVLIWMGYYFGMPENLEECPVPSILVVCDWHVHYTIIREMVDAFDYILCDRALLQVLQAKGYTHCAYWPAYSFAPEIVREYPSERDLDLTFIGNFSPAIYSERNRHLMRLAPLAQDYKLFYGSRVYHPDYSRVLSRSKLVFNHSIRQEMNLRAYEAAACGALCLVEEENLEIRDFLTPGESCVLYNKDNLLELARYYLEHPDQARRIAEAGQRQIQNYNCEKQFAMLLERLPGILQQLAPERSYRRKSQLRRQLLRILHFSTTDMPELRAQGILLLEQMLSGPLSERERLQVLSALAVCHTDYRASAEAGYTPDFSFRYSCEQAQQLFQEALEQSPETDPLLLHNLLWIYALNDRRETMLPWLEKQQQLLQIRPSAESFEDFGLFILPLGYTQFFIRWQRLQQQHENQPEDCRQQLYQMLVWSCLYHYGMFAAEHQQFDLALAAFKGAREACDDFSDTYLEMARAYLKLNQAEAALSCLWLGIERGVYYPQSWLTLLYLLHSRRHLETARQSLKTAKVLFMSSRFSQLQQALAHLDLMLRQEGSQSQSEGFLA